MKQLIENQKLLIVGMLIFSLFGYLEWGKGSSTFLFQAEAEVLQKLLVSPMEALHPFTVLPLLGQILLLVALLRSPENRKIIYTGIFFLSALPAFMLLIAALSMNIKIFLSVTPFFLCVYLYFRAIKKPR